MLTIYNSEKSSSKSCDGVSRRNFIKVGALGGALSLADLVRADQRNGNPRNPKSVIMIYLVGGPPHQDMVDLKPEAPPEIRGEFSPISTSVPGIQICEHMPMLAQRMDKLAIIRSLYGAKDRHDAFQCMTGWLKENQPVGGWPSYGSVVSKLQGQVKLGIPSFVGLSPRMRTGTWSDPGQPGFLGKAHAPFLPNADGAANIFLAMADRWPSIIIAASNHVDFITAARAMFM